MSEILYCLYPDKLILFIRDDLIDFNNVLFHLVSQCNLRLYKTIKLNEQIFYILRKEKKPRVVIQ